MYNKKKLFLVTLNKNLNFTLQIHGPRNCPSLCARSPEEAKCN